MRARWFVLGMMLLAAGVRADGQLEDPEVARRAGPPPPRPREQAIAGKRFLHFDPARNQSGALAGKTVYVSAGHGWVWDTSLGRWRTQRGNTHDLVEDFISTETIAQHLIPLLHDMGAYVVPVREADMSGEMVIVDDAAAEVDGAATASSDGFALAGLPLTGGTNPFAGGGSRMATAGAPDAVARWTLAPAADLEGFVYLSWVQAPDRAPDAHYVIHHAGGASHVRVDQRRHGSTWVLIGRYRFSPADPPERRQIELLGDSATAGATLSIDAVRVGGGAGRIDRGMGTSGRPAFEDGARYQAQWNGAPASVWDYSTGEDGQDDVGTRSRFSAWDHEAGEDAVYVAWHTNAPSPARGTSSFAYGPNAFGPLSEFSGVPGSLELMDAIHRELIADLRAGWEPTWQDRAQHTAYFGEVNPNHNPEMPATLIEIAFHDTLADANALREPRFRHLASRAIAQGIARYFATRDGGALVLPPEPPAAVAAAASGDGWSIRWQPPVADAGGGDPATDYVVYLSRDGRSFDDGHVTTEMSFTIAGGEMRFARVVARNAGGRSRPSPVVGAAGRAAEPDVLVVAGFTRLDGAMLFREDLSSRGLGTLDRAYEDRINDGSHGARIGAALGEAGYGFAIAAVDAVRGGTVALPDYRAVIWLGGEEAAPLTAEDRAALATYLDGGGALVLTGTDAAAALAVDDPQFLAGLGAGFVADDAGTYGLVGVPAPIDGMAFRFDDTGIGGYDADAPDVLDGSLPLLHYDDGRAAAIATREAWRAAVFGFPIETVAGQPERARILAVALATLGTLPEADDDPPDPEISGGCCDAGADPGALAVPLLGVLAALTRRRRVTNMRPS